MRVIENKESELSKIKAKYKVLVARSIANDLPREVTETPSNRTKH